MKMAPPSDRAQTLKWDRGRSEFQNEYLIGEIQRLDLRYFQSTEICASKMQAKSGSEYSPALDRLPQAIDRMQGNWFLWRNAFTQYWPK